MRLGELCAGYGGLGMAVEEVFGATTAWFSEYDAAPSNILAHHWPDVPNYGDMTKIDWAGIEHVDIISGGTPCQDLSAAGRRAGMTEGTRSNLWVQMREAIAIQKPAYVVWENVRGAYSATAASDLEQCPGCMGDTGDGGTVLRALGRVLGDLSDLGFDTQWRGLRAADVGACHGRFRVFVAARRRNAWYPNVQDVEGGRTAGWGDADTQQSSGTHRGAGYGHRATPLEDADLPARGERRQSAPGQAPGGRTWPHPGRRSGTLASDTASSRRAEGQDRGTGCSNAGPGTWRVQPERGYRERTNWGDYAPAIARWEAAMGRRAPSPTEPTGRNGGHRLSPRFTEWMMGLPDGWVTDPAIGISRNDQLKACGNGVVPQQAIAALTDMLNAFQAKDIAA